MNDWPSRSLGTVTSKIGSGATPRGGASVYGSTGIAFIRSQNVLDNRLLVSEVARISDHAARDLDNVTVQPGDVLINITGDSIARSTLVPQSVLPARVSQHVAIIRPTPELDSGFLQRLLVEPSMKAHLVTISQGGGTRKALTKAQLSALSVPVPPLPVQQAIAEVLGALDDKIAANVTLVARAGQLSLALVASHQPSVSLSSVVTLRKRSLTPDAFGPNPVAHFSLPAYDEGQLPVMTDPTEIKSAKVAIDSPSVLVSKLNPRFPRIWNLPVLPSGGQALASTEFLVLDSEHASSSLLWAILSQPSFSQELQGKAAGTSGSHQRVRPDALLATDVIDPRLVSERVHTTVTSLGQTIHFGRQESRSLAVLRDTLLPQLVSGKIRVKDAERAVSEVV